MDFILTAVLRRRRAAAAGGAECPAETGHQIPSYTSDVTRAIRQNINVANTQYKDCIVRKRPIILRAILRLSLEEKGCLSNASIDLEILI